MRQGKHNFRVPLDFRIAYSISQRVVHLVRSKYWNKLKINPKTQTVDSGPKTIIVLLYEM